MIRALDENDIDLFTKIRKDSLQTDPRLFGASPFAEINREETKEDLRAKNEENFILGYFDNDEIVGMLGFVRFKNVKTRHKGFIWGVFVYEAHRGKKIGRMLMQKCIDRVKKLPGMQKILLGVSHVSDSAWALYRNMGFVEYGREKNAMIWEGENIDEILMEREL